MATEQKEREESLKRHLNGLYRTQKEVGVLTSLSQQARWFVRERKEEKFVKLLSAEFNRSRKLKSGMLLRTLLLVDKLLRQFRSFRPHIAPVIVQMFVELFSIFFESDSFGEVVQLKKLRKRWVTLLPDECLLKMKSNIKKRFGFDLDSGFSEAIIQELKDYYLKELKLTPEQCQLYLPKVKTKQDTNYRSYDRSPESRSPSPQERPTKRLPEQPPRNAPISHASPLIAPTYQSKGPVHQNVPHYDPYGQQRHVAPQPYPQQLPPGYPPRYYYHPGQQMTMAQSHYMQYPQQHIAYHPSYYPSPAQYQQMMDPYYQKHPSHMPPHPDYYQQPLMEDRMAHQQPFNDYVEARRDQDREREQERQREKRMPKSNNLTPFASQLDQNYSSERSKMQHAQQSSLSAQQKLQELRLGSLRCPRCGLLSAQRESFDLHLKSHFQQSRRAYEIVKRNGPVERAHLPDAQQWLEDSSEEDEKEYLVDMLLAHDKVCRLCASEFKPSWDAKLEKWVYRGAVSVKVHSNDATFHYDCYKALQTEETLQSDS